MDSPPPPLREVLKPLTSSLPKTLKVEGNRSPPTTRAQAPKFGLNKTNVAQMKSDFEH